VIRGHAHDLLNDGGKAQVKADITAWITAHTAVLEALR
jgi:hypothetical protein